MFEDNRGYPDLVRLESVLDRGLELIAVDVSDDLGWSALEEASVGIEQAVRAAHALHHLLVSMAGLDERTLTRSPEYRAALDIAAGLAGHSRAVAGAPSFEWSLSSLVGDRSRAS